MTCGFKNSAGTDLDDIFYTDHSNSGGLGFVAQDKEDIGNRYTSGATLGYAVGFLNSAGTDIGYLRGDIPPPMLLTENPFSSNLNKDTDILWGSWGETDNHKLYANCSMCSGSFTLEILLNTSCEVSFYINPSVTNWHASHNAGSTSDAYGTLTETTNILGHRSYNLYTLPSNTLLGTVQNFRQGTLRFDVSAKSYTGTGSSSSYEYRSVCHLWFVATNAQGSIQSSTFHI